MNDSRKQLEARLPIRDLLLYITSARTLLEIVHETASFSMHVASTMRGNLNMMASEELSTVWRMSETAEREVKSGFPLLHSNSLIGLWGALEACVSDLSLLFLQCLERDDLANALSESKVKLSDYLILDDQDRWPWLLSQIERSAASSLRAGIGQFDPVLDALGVKTRVDGNVRTVLFRAKLLRNLYAHRAGRADARFLRDWPEQKVSEGQLVLPTSQQVIATMTASVIYADAVADTMSQKLGVASKGMALPPWISSTDELLTMFEPNPVVPSGAPWSFHLTQDPEPDSRSAQ